MKDTILFVHGAWHGAWCWEKYFVKQFLDRGYKSITFDLPKHSKPGKTENINKLSLKDYVEALKKEVGKLDSLPIIIGHSMGGLILQKYLETETCKKAILLASAPPNGILRTTIKLLTKSYTYPSLLTLNLFGLVNTTKKARWAFFSEELPKEELKEYTEKLCGESFRVFVNMQYPNIKLNNHLKIPMLVIGATKDNIFTVRENELTARKYGADIKIINGIAHNMMLDVNQEKVSAVIIEWLDKKAH
jgi:alpha-beta hydrolase superfamily lysophospholipase